MIECGGRGQAPPLHPESVAKAPVEDSLPTPDVGAVLAPALRASEPTALLNHHVFVRESQGSNFADQVEGAGDQDEVIGLGAS